MYYELTNNDILFLTNYDDDGRYCIYLSKKHPNWIYLLMDFINYHKNNNFIVEYKVKNEDLELAEKEYKDFCYDGALREYESKILVHSTSLQNWNTITQSMKLKSWNKAVMEGNIDEIHPIGDLLNDPISFRDFVMLGEMTWQNEIVVLSKQLGKLTYDKDQAYTPGVRIYIDAKKLAQDGLLLRDGIHLMVKDYLDLGKYMIDFVEASKLPITVFTPFTFSEMADDFFKRKHPDFA